MIFLPFRRKEKGFPRGRKKKTFLKTKSLYRVLIKMKRVLTGKRGLSEIVATLIVILLVIIAIGIIWTVVRNLIQSGSEQIDLASKCSNLDINAINVTENPDTDGTYWVRLTRGSDNGETLSGVQINFFNGATSSGLHEFGATLDPLDDKTQEIVVTDAAEAVFTGASKIVYIPYFDDEAGTAQLCPNGERTFEFTAKA